MQVISPGKPEGETPGCFLFIPLWDTIQGQSGSVKLTSQTKLFTTPINRLTIYLPRVFPTNSVLPDNNPIHSPIKPR